MQRTGLNTFAKLALILFALFCVFTVIKLKIEINDLEDRKTELEQKIAVAEEEVAALQNKLDTPFDEEYVAALAKEKLNLVMPDEVIFYNDLTE